MKVFRCQGKKETRERAITALNNLLEKEKGKPVLLLLAGGSAFELFDGIDANFISKNTTIGFADERYSKDPLINNFAHFTQTHLFAKAKKRGAKFIDTRIHNKESLKSLSRRFGKALRSWRKENPAGKIIIIQGMGQDGHTAGIMPTFLFDNPHQWVVGYDAEEKDEYPLRVTVTFSFLKNNVDHAIAYITGEKKRKAFERLISRKGSLCETPARIMHEMRDVKIFTDIV